MSTLVVPSSSRRILSVQHNSRLWLTSNSSSDEKSRSEVDSKNSSVGPKKLNFIDRQYFDTLEVYDKPPFDVGPGEEASEESKPLNLVDDEDKLIDKYYFSGQKRHKDNEDYEPELVSADSPYAPREKMAYIDEQFFGDDSEKKDEDSEQTKS